VRLLIEANQTTHIENVVNEFCKEFKLIDVDVCMGAVHEYKVKTYFFLTKKGKEIFIYSQIGCSHCCYDFNEL